jgi:hypothetical protein
VRLTFVMVGDMIKPVRIVHEGRRDAAETEAVREQVKAEVKVKRLSGPHVDLSLSLIAERPRRARGSAAVVGVHGKSWLKAS